LENHIGKPRTLPANPLRNFLFCVSFSAFEYLVLVGAAIDFVITFAMMATRRSLYVQPELAGYGSPSSRNLDTSRR
jgi:hypothetical protein